MTHDVRADVEHYLKSADAPEVAQVVLLAPEGGASAQSIQGGDHAYNLAVQLPGILARHRPNRSARVHLFFAAPNSLMFFVGRQRDALGRLTLYEFDFGLERDSSYQPSLSVPLDPHEHSATLSEASDDSSV